MSAVEHIMSAVLSNLVSFPLEYPLTYGIFNFEPQFDLKSQLYVINTCNMANILLFCYLAAISSSSHTH